MAKQQFELECLIKSSNHVLYNCMSTPSGLSEWFADDVNVKGDTFTFMWEGEEKNADLIAKKKDQMVRFRWNDEVEENTFFEIRIKIDDMTGEVALIITDFAEPAEIKDAKLLWETAIENLRHIVGS